MGAVDKTDMLLSSVECVRRKKLYKAFSKILNKLKTPIDVKLHYWKNYEHVTKYYTKSTID